MGARNDCFAGRKPFKGSLGHWKGDLNGTPMLHNRIIYKAVSTHANRSRNMSKAGTTSIIRKPVFNIHTLLNEMLINEWERTLPPIDRYFICI